MPVMDDEMQQHFLHLYQHEFPQKEHLSITSHTSIDTGWESDIFLVCLDYDEAAIHTSEEVVLKLYHGQTGTQKAQKEAQALKQLALAGYPVPKLLVSAMDSSPFGRACIVMEKIPGRTLLQVFGTSPSIKQQELLTSFCQLYIDLHQLAWQLLVSDSTQYQTDRFIYSGLLLARTYIGQLQPGVFDPVFNWLQSRSESISCSRLSVIHGDFHPENVLLRDDGASFVIDWTSADISDYRFDLAWTLLLFSSIGSGELRNIVLAEYERLAGQRVEQLDFFEAFACCRRLFDISTSLSSSAHALGMKSDAELLMRENSTHIRLVYTQLQALTGCSLPEIEQLITMLAS